MTVTIYMVDGKELRVEGEPAKAVLIAVENDRKIIKVVRIEAVHWIYAEHIVRLEVFG